MVAIAVALGAWFLLTVPLGIALGAAFKRADRRAHARAKKVFVADLSNELAPGTSFAS
jgi:hypothetical protein